MNAYLQQFPPTSIFTGFIYLCLIPHKISFSLFFENYPNSPGREQLGLVHQPLFVRDSHTAGLQVCRSCLVCLYIVIGGGKAKVEVCAPNKPPGRDSFKSVLLPFWSTSEPCDSMSQVSEEWEHRKHRLMRKEWGRNDVRCAPSLCELLSILMRAKSREPRDFYYLKVTRLEWRAFGTVMVLYNFLSCQWEMY